MILSSEFRAIFREVDGDLWSVQSELRSRANGGRTATWRRWVWRRDAEILPCALSAEVFEALERGDAETAVLPIENSLHGSVAEHYDLLLGSSVSVVGERQLRIRHNVIAAPGVRLEEVQRVMSHPVALSQCRRWLRAHPGIEAVPCYDTAGSVKQLMADWSSKGARDVAGVAPELAAREYGAEVLVAGVEDHAENFTRFYVLKAGEASWG